MSSLFESRLIFLVLLSLSLSLIVVEIRSEDGEVRQSVGPGPLKISSGFHHFAHDLHSGDIFALNERQIQITNLKYDGKGPAAWFTVGSNGTEYKKERGGLHYVTLLPDETGSCRILRKYNGETIVLTLPNNITIHDITFLSMFCFKFDHNFGYVEIPQNISPSSLPDANQVTEVKNCPRLYGAAPVSVQANTFAIILMVATSFLLNNFNFRDVLGFGLK